jgi:hypothetical protein
MGRLVRPHHSYWHWGIKSNVVTEFKRRIWNAQRTVLLLLLRMSSSCHVHVATSDVSSCSRGIGHALVPLMPLKHPETTTLLHLSLCALTVKLSKWAFLQLTSCYCTRRYMQYSPWKLNHHSNKFNYMILFFLISVHTEQQIGAGGSSASSVWLQTGQPGFDPRQRQSIFTLASVSKPPLRPIQPPIQWIRGPLPGDKVRPRRDADHSPQSSAEVKNE